MDSCTLCTEEAVIPFDMLHSIYSATELEQVTLELMWLWVFFRLIVPEELKANSVCKGKFCYVKETPPKYVFKTVSI